MSPIEMNLASQDNLTNKNLREIPGLIQKERN